MIAAGTFKDAPHTMPHTMNERCQSSHEETCLTLKGYFDGTDVSRNCGALALRSRAPHSHLAGFSSC